MASLTDYCTPASVRAVLGVSDEELEDATILDPIYLTMFTEALAGVNDGLIAAYAAAVPPHTPTATESRYIALIQTYAAYSVAQQMLGSAKMFAPQTIMDSKSQVSRVVEPFKDLAADIFGSLNFLTGKILAVYQILFPTAAVTLPPARVFMSSVALGTDPVTGV